MADDKKFPNQPKRSAPGTPAKKSGKASQDESLSLESELEISRVAAQINEMCAKAHQGAVQKYLQTARILSEARQSLPDSEFDQLWAHAEQTMNIKFDLQRFMFMGEKLGDLAPGLCREVPRHWAILYCLAQVERDVIKSGVKAGKIHPRLSLKEAERLLGVSRYGPAGPREDEDPALYVLDDLVDGLQSLGFAIEGPDYPPDSYEFAGEMNGYDFLLFLELLDDDKGVDASVMIYPSEESEESVDFDKKFPLNVTARRIHDWVARSAAKLDKPGFNH